MPTTPKKSSSSGGSKSSKPKNIADLSPDQIDAVLRDPNVPGSVRAAVGDHHAAQLYLSGVEFNDNGDGFLTVAPKDA